MTKVSKKQFIKELIRRKIFSVNDLNMLKRKWARRYKNGCLANVELLSVYNKMVKKGEVKRVAQLEKLLKKRPIRTLSGVAVVAVLTKPYFCPGICIYCPTQKTIPKSYLKNEPAVMRAVMCDFDAFKQVQTRIRMLEAAGHSTDKIELIIMGGTWSYLPKKYQLQFIIDCFRACNKINQKSKIKNQKLRNLKRELEKQQKLNEKAPHRIVGLTLETRPDFINEEEIKWMRKLGCTRVEIGVQNIDDRILKKVKRGHTVEDTIKATKLLKDAGFKVCYHMMPNLPGATPRKDLKMFKKLFYDPNFCPDQLKIYPTVVVKDSELYQWWKKGRFKPYSQKQLEKLLLEIKKNVPPWVRIVRLIRDIPSYSIVAGNKISNLRQILDEKKVCHCIRCREVKSLPLDRKNLKLSRYDYNASFGKEIFLSFENPKKNILYAHLRLRIPSGIFNGEKHFISNLTNAAIVRELQTYGESLPIASKKKHIQHLGLGQKLLKEAEKISRNEFNLKKIAVISGIGAREYYRKFGYRLENGYMVKKLK
jgi:elongator complex protein 3